MSLLYYKLSEFEEKIKNVNPFIYIPIFISKQPCYLYIRYTFNHLYIDHPIHSNLILLKIAFRYVDVYTIDRRNIVTLNYCEYIHIGLRIAYTRFII